MRIEWHTVGNICHRVYEDRKQEFPNPLDGLVRIGIDETSYKKGHKYMTVVVNHDTNTVVWCAIGYGKTVLAQFFQLLSSEQRASIQCVSADGAKWIASCIEEYCPQAERCVDPFHVVSWATDLLDNFRRQALKEAKNVLKEAPKRRRGRPKKGEEKAKEGKTPTMKSLRYVVLKNPEHLSVNQQEQLELLVKTNPLLYRGYLLKEGLRLALKEPIENIEYALEKWMAWAQRCRIPEFRKLREKIKRQMTAIIASSRHHLSNARIEATNNKIKLTIRTAFGFRNLDNMLTMIMLKCSNVKLMLPGRE
jgi:transposase